MTPPPDALPGALAAPVDGTVAHAGGGGLAQRLALALTGFGLLAFALAAGGLRLGGGWTALAASLGATSLGAVAWFWLEYRARTPGIENDGTMRSPLKRRGAIAWALAVAFTGFYVVLYFYEPLQQRGMPAVLEGSIALVDPLARSLSGQPADKWFLYTVLYTLAVLVMGARMLAKYRTVSVMFFQLGFACLVPAFLKAMQQPEFYFTYFWPLKQWYGWPDGFAHFRGAGVVGLAFFVFGAAMTLVATPVLTYFYGKRWYCSWVCGCGGLAETAGDPWRQNSDKSLAAWKVERWMVHSVLVFVVAATAVLWINSAREGRLLGDWSSPLASAYSLYVGMIFSGVVGVGFYPLMGSRVWCRFGCPMAAILGIFQRFFSRFRITTNGGQCISCGNCSTYCEMGIDVRAYAQRGENVVRASCVGCGVCSSVCPRGVLNLENGPTHADRFPGADRPVAAFLRSLGVRDRGR